MEPLVLTSALSDACLHHPAHFTERLSDPAASGRGATQRWAWRSDGGGRALNHHPPAPQGGLGTPRQRGPRPLTPGVLAHVLAKTARQGLSSCCLRSEGRQDGSESAGGLACVQVPLGRDRASGMILEGWSVGPSSPALSQACLPACKTPGLRRALRDSTPRSCLFPTA